MTKQNLPTIFDRSFPFGSLFNHSIGMDRYLERVFDDFLPGESANKYPPYNIRKENDHTTIIEMALAGYDKNSIEITVQNGILSINGNKVSQIDESKTEYVYQGLASRSFVRKFALADLSEVVSANLKDGMLYITVDTKAPELPEIKRIPISTVTEEGTALPEK